VGRGLAVLSLVVVFITGSAAQAAPAASVYVTGGLLKALTYVAVPGTVDAVTIAPDRSGGYYLVTSSAPMAATSPCSSTTSTTVSCPSSGINLLSVSLGDGNDSLTVYGSIGGTLRGQAGNDVLDGSSAFDSFVGGSGVDRVSYADHTAAVTARIGSSQPGAEDGIAGDVERLTGGQGADLLIGNGDGNVLDGQAGGDRLQGQAGDDTLLGGDANDYMLGGAGADVQTGGGGADTAAYTDHAAGVAATLDGVANDGSAGEHDQITQAETLVGSPHADVLTGNGVSNTFNGFGGTDILNGLGGDDSFLAQANGNETLNGGSGVDTVIYYRPGFVGDSEISLDNVANDGYDDGFTHEHDNVRTTVENIVNVTSGLLEAYARESDIIDNRIQSTLGAFLFPGGGNDTLIGSNFGDMFFAGSGDDTLLGNGGADELEGGPGSDLIDGGAGEDSCTVDANDTVVNCEHLFQS
jgi:Ca2+-binding RTX toxin-like protein